MTPEEFDELIDSIEGDSYRMATFHDNTLRIPVREMKKLAKSEYRKVCADLARATTHWDQNWEACK
jgi:hypothetical protein